MQALGVKASGSKIELNNVIKAYFSGNKILPEKKIIKRTKTTIKELTLGTGLIECGFTFGNRFREFYTAVQRKMQEQVLQHIYSGYYLHFGVSINGGYVNPMRYLN